MPSLKDLKNRIGSVKSTQKITKAMQMVSAAKLRRAKERAESARPYAEHMQRLVASLARNAEGVDAPFLLNGTGRDDVHLLVVMTSDRGLCGGFNSSIVRAVRLRVDALQAQGKTVKLLCVGRKGYEQLAMKYKPLIIGRMSEIGKKGASFQDAKAVSDAMLALAEEHGVDVCVLYYNHFKSAISQVVTPHQIIPLVLSAEPDLEQVQAIYEYEPDEETMLPILLKRNVETQVLHALLENNASEQGARMSAMDNATRNAGDMIRKLTLQYNRSRQAAITKELIEIISGAEAV